ncbi:phage protein [Staphylococcus aureus]|nr:phage protein [Staphylococcus aureus]
MKIFKNFEELKKYNSDLASELLEEKEAGDG